MRQNQWPAKLWLVRHGQSAGNLANDHALAAGSQTIETLERDMDVPLSPLGERQAAALGQWFSALAVADRPELVLSSPYLRAWETAEAIAVPCGLREPAALAADERLREKELGLLNRLTSTGITALYPDQAKLRSAIGKFYYRPPSGESWCDVILRLRSALETICLHYAGKRLVIVSHQVVVLCFRYLLEQLDEEKLLAIDGAGAVKNCGVTEYAFDAEAADGGMTLVRYNFTAPLAAAGAPVTAEPSAASSSQQ